MRRTVMIAMAAGAALAAAPDAATSRSAGQGTLQVVATVQPLDGGQGGRGLVHIGGRPGEPLRARGILAGLPSGPEDTNVALAPQACDQYHATRPEFGIYDQYDTPRPAVDINDLYVFASPRVPPSGTALIDAHGAVALDELQRAQSIVVVGEPREDGMVELAACGDSAQHVVDWSGTSRRDVFAAAALLGGGAGDPHVLAVAATSGTTAVMLTDLLPRTDYGLGATHSDKCAERPNDRIRFTTDATGSALLSVSAANPRSLGDRGALAVARPTADGPEPVACAPFETGTLID